jgi:prepilin-type N-terminal cleavage/methylation domain-containing protein
MSCQRYAAVESGFTLVEGIVAVVISSILAGVMFMILKMNNDCVKDGAVSAKAHSQYETVIAEIGTYTRRACAVLDEGIGEIYRPDSTYTAVAASKIMMDTLDANGTPGHMRGFWVDGGVLKEWTGSGWVPFTVGAWPTVSVPDTAPFQLSASRKTVTVSMRVSAALGGDTAVAPARGEVFICRN